jgi:hypothetical protein
MFDENSFKKYKRYILFFTPIIIVIALILTSYASKESQNDKVLPKTKNGVLSLNTKIRGVLDDIEEASDLVLLGTIVSTRTAFDNGSIYTYSTIRPQKIFKGRAEGEIIVRWAGGSVEGVGMLDSNQESIRWQKGEECLLFLRPSSRSPFYVISEFGKFTVEKLSTGQEVIRSSPQASFEIKDQEEIRQDGQYPQPSYISKGAVLEYLNRR